MNAAARQAAEGYGSIFSVRVFLTGQAMKFWFLLLIFLASGFAVVYEKEVYRHHLALLQHLQQSHGNLQVHAKQLLLEQTSWGAAHRVQKVAETRLGMRGIEQRSVIMVRL